MYVYMIECMYVCMCTFVCPLSSPYATVIFINFLIKWTIYVYYICVCFTNKIYSYLNIHLSFIYYMILHFCTYNAITI